MTIGTLAARQSYTTLAGINAYPVPIQAYNATDFLVLLTPAGGGAAITLVLNSDYSMATSGTQNPTQWTLTNISAQTQVAGLTLQIILNPVENQNTQFVQGQAFPSLAVQTAFDRNVQMSQRLSDQISRTLRIPDGDANAANMFPPASQRANLSAIFDSAGQPTVGTPVSTTLAIAQVSFYGVDSGIANAYVVAVTGTIPISLTIGVLLRFTALNADTGPSTVNAGGTGVQPVVGQTGLALTGGEIPSTGPTWVQWTGSSWQIVGTGANPDRARSATEITNNIIPVNYFRAAFDPRRYGAIGDGVTDDTAKLNTALICNTLVDGYGLSYATTDQVNCPAAVNFRHATIIMANADYTAVSWSNDVVIENVRVVGTGRTHGGNPGPQQIGFAELMQVGTLTGTGTNGTYTSIALTGGNGANAKATVTVAGGVVTAVTITSNGTGAYASNWNGGTADTLSFTIPGGSGTCKVTFAFSQHLIINARAENCNINFDLRGTSNSFFRCIGINASGNSAWSEGYGMLVRQQASRNIIRLDGVGNARHNFYISSGASHNRCEVRSNGNGRSTNFAIQINSTLTQPLCYGNYISGASYNDAGGVVLANQPDGADNAGGVVENIIDAFHVYGVGATNTDAAFLTTLLSTSATQPCDGNKFTNCRAYGTYNSTTHGIVDLNHGVNTSVEGMHIRGTSANTTTGAFSITHSAAGSPTGGPYGIDRIKGLNMDLMTSSVSVVGFYANVSGGAQYTLDDTQIVGANTGTYEFFSGSSANFLVGPGNTYVTSVVATAVPATSGQTVTVAVPSTVKSRTQAIAVVSAQSVANNAQTQAIVQSFSGTTLTLLVYNGHSVGQNITVSVTVFGLPG